MKTLIFLTLTLLLTSCGGGPDEIVKLGPVGPSGAKGDKGDPGESVVGPSGQNGSNGHNSLVTAVRSASIDPLICATHSGVVVKAGLDSNDNNVLDSSEQTSLTFVCDGLTGPMGPQGLPGTPAVIPPMSIVAIIDPCGDKPGIIDEVLLKMQNGTIIASFSDDWTGHNTRFAVLTSGTYQTTDGSNCVFTVDASNNVINQHY